jgi:hypothetical protein
MTIINLFEEVIESLKCCGKTSIDVHYVVLNDRRSSFQNFCDISKKIDYDNGYGRAYIPVDLCIVGDTWWLSRAEYDGSEWFRFNQKPSPVDVMSIEDLSSVLTMSVAGIDGHK